MNALESSSEAKVECMPVSWSRDLETRLSTSRVLPTRVVLQLILVPYALYGWHIE
jgi:hypothetical protein